MTGRITVETSKNCTNKLPDNSNEQKKEISFTEIKPRAISPTQEKRTQAPRKHYQQSNNSAITTGQINTQHNSHFATAVVSFESSGGTSTALY